MYMIYNFRFILTILISGCTELHTTLRVIHCDGGLGYAACVKTSGSHWYVDPNADGNTKAIFFMQLNLSVSDVWERNMEAT